MLLETLLSRQPLSRNDPSFMKLLRIILALTILATLGFQDRIAAGQNQNASKGKSKSQKSAKAKAEPSNNGSGYVVLKSEIPSLAVPRVLQGAVEQSGQTQHGTTEGTTNSVAVDSALAAIAAIKNAGTLDQMAQQYIAGGNLSGAEACLQQLTTLNPFAGQAFTNLARLQAREGRQNAAIANFWIGRELGATTTDDNQTISDLQSRLTQQCQASGMRYHDYPAFNDKNDVRALLNQGVRFYSIGDHKDAWRLFSEAAKQAPQNPDAYYNLGALCESLGLNDRAKQFYFLACKIDPTDFASRLGLGTPGQGQFGYQGSASRNPLNSAVSVCPLCRLARGKMMRGD
jgi:tetratricopeptide (TPR) repeat protein